MKSWTRPLFPWISPDVSPRITARGRIALTLGLTALATGALVLQPLLIGIGLAVLILLFLAAPCAALNVEGLAYRRLLPASLYAEEPVDMELEIVNLKQHIGSWHLLVHDETLAHPEPILFAVARPGQRLRRVHDTRFARRGVYRGMLCRVTSDFPLGLFQAEKLLITGETFTVYPQPKPQRELAQWLEAGSGLGGFGRNAAADIAGEFRAMREYRQGDQAKMISWPFSARFQTLIVRETERPTPRTLSIVFHGYQAPHTFLTPRSFEISMQLLSGLFIQLYQHGIRVAFTSTFMNWHRIQVTHDATGLAAAMTKLATAEMPREPSLAPLIQALRDEAALSEGVIAVSNSPLRYWVDALPRVAAPLLCLDSLHARLIQSVGVNP